MVFRDIWRADSRLSSLHAQLVAPDPDEWNVLERARMKAASDRARCTTSDSTACGSLVEDLRRQISIEKDFAAREGPLAALTG